MPALLAGVLAMAWGIAGTARAGTCSEDHETCFESCQIDFGMEKERVKLTACVERCGEKLEDCRDLTSQQRLFEPPPSERRYAPPSNVRQFDEYDDGSVVREESRPAEGRAGAAARELDWEEAPPADWAAEESEAPLPLPQEESRGAESRPSDDEEFRAEREPRSADVEPESRTHQVEPEARRPSIEPERRPPEERPARPQPAPKATGKSDDLDWGEWD